MNHEVTKGTKEEKIQRNQNNLHQNNLAEWVMVFALLYPARIAVAAWNNVRRLVCFVASWFNRN